MITKAVIFCWWLLYNLGWWCSGVGNVFCFCSLYPSMLVCYVFSLIYLVGWFVLAPRLQISP